MRRPLTVLAAVGLLAACGADGAATGTAGSTIGEASSTVPAAIEGPGSEATDGDATSTTMSGVAAPEALQFSAAQVGGEPLDLRQFAGTTVALWFWAPT